MHYQEHHLFESNHLYLHIYPSSNIKIVGDNTNCFSKALMFPTLKTLYIILHLITQLFGYVIAISINKFKYRFRKI